MVMGRDSRSESCEFESKHRILDGHIFTFICNVCLKRPKINDKEAIDGPFLKNYYNNYPGKCVEDMFRKYSLAKYLNIIGRQASS